MKQLTNDRYEILNQIGRGSYASVYKAINCQTGEICAIKKIPVEDTESTTLVNEIKIMRECDCDNIVRLLTSTCSDKEVLIIMEYCSAGSVKDVMRQLKRTMNQNQITAILKGVLTGLDYLHSKNKIHRDVKAANILLNEAGMAKLGDFGVSEPSDPKNPTNSIIGTLLWVPPEVARGECYGPVIDIWSLGITILEMAEGQPPYSEMDESSALKRIRDSQEPSPTFRDESKWDPNLVDFLKCCLEKDALERKTAAQLLNHELFNNSLSNDVLKSLVAEVCSTSFRATEQETTLYRRSESLLKESVILFNIYKERRMKVIRVDQLTDSLRSVEKDYQASEEKMAQRYANINKIREQSKVLANEITKLERQKMDLKFTSESLEKEKKNIMEQLKSVDSCYTSFSSRRM